MENAYKFADAIKGMSGIQLDDEIQNPNRLLMHREPTGKRSIEIAYAPFDHVNTAAKIVIVGITPGRQQMQNALVEFQRNMQAGESIEIAAKAAKKFASFSGPIRKNLVCMLDYLGINNLLDLGSCEELWGASNSLAHFTSALRYPVFLDGNNYSGTPDMLKNRLLRSEVERWFAEECRSLCDAVFVPLGPKVTNAINHIASMGIISSDQVLSGLPHPSGANAERIAYFLEKKARETLSVKTAPDLLDQNRRSLFEKIKNFS